MGFFAFLKSALFNWAKNKGRGVPLNFCIPKNQFVATDGEYKCITRR